MSRIRADKVTDRAGTGPVTLTYGADIAGVTTAAHLNVTGVTTATTFKGNLEATTATLGGSDIISTDNTKTLTNKTIVAGNNTISGITSSMFSSAVTLQILDSSGSAVKTIIGNAS